MPTDESNGKLPPWWAGKPQRKVSDKQEKSLSKRLGFRQHSNSGAGKEKHDMSNDELLVEVKRTDRKSYALNASYWQALQKVALSQNKEPIMILDIQGNELVVMRLALFEGKFNA
jgi:hypothetical protein